MMVILGAKCKGYPNKNTVTMLRFLTLCLEHRKKHSVRTRPFRRAVECNCPRPYVWMKSTWR